MPVFISYSHSDKDFVDELAARIVANRGSVWLDRWELNVGDSLIERVQDAIATSSALLVVLSKASVESEWCRKELSAGLVRELGEKRVVVLPVLKEDCAVPLFLQDKLYADFREDYDAGFSAVIDAITAVTNRDQSRIEKGDYHVDWAQDWGFEGWLYWLRFTLVQSMKDAPVTILTTILVRSNEAATERYQRLAADGFDWFARETIAGLLQEYSQEHNVNLLLEDTMEKSYQFGIKDSRSERAYHVTISARRMGTDTGKIQVVQISNYLRDIAKYTRNASRRLTAEEQRTLLKLLA
jgi:TIR domain